MTNPIRFTLNGAPAEALCRADMTVLEWLRLEALLRGTKEGCAEGDCGACSVLVKRPGASQGGATDDARYQAANACIMLMGQMEGAGLVTVEGLAALPPANGNEQHGHAVQNRMAENGSSQCGFCTPGIVVALAGLLDRETDPDDAAIHDALAGNLCRCTGYRPIVEAAHAAAKAEVQRLPESADIEPKAEVGGSPSGAEEQESSRAFLPQNLADLIALREAHPDATLLAGGTDLALDVAHARARWPKIILTRHVAELRGIETSDTHLTFGGAVTWEEALPAIDQHWPSFATLVRRFGSVQIRSMGTIAGNLATASPIGDGAPALLALGAHLTLAGPEGERELALDEFFVDYRKSALRPGEVIRSIHVPLAGISTTASSPRLRVEGGRRPDEGGGDSRPRERDDGIAPHPPTSGSRSALAGSYDLSPQAGRGENGKTQHHFRVYKLSKRYDQDISTVCGAFALTMEGDTVTGARVAFGGMAATPKRWIEAEEALTGKPLSASTIAEVKDSVSQAFQPMSDMRGTADYRALAAANLVERLALDLAGETVEVMALEAAE